MSNSKSLNSLGYREPITMIKGNRLSDLSSAERQDFFNFLNEHKKDKDILTQIRNKFGLDYNKTSMRYIGMMANRKDEVKHIQEDNKVMEKWAIPDNTSNNPNYADFLNDLANQRITKEEFSNNTQSNGFC